MDKNINKIGFYTALAAAVASAGFSVAQILQVAGVIAFPVDEYLIYGFSLLIPVPLIVAMLVLHHTVSEEKKFLTHGALLFTVMYAGFVILNYVVQLATVIPNELLGDAGAVSVLHQSPHSLFWDIDAIGYIFMGLAALFAFPVFAQAGPEKWTRRFFLYNFLMTPVIAAVYFYPTFSIPLLIVGSPWLITATGSMFFLARYFHGRDARTATVSY